MTSSSGSSSRNFDRNNRELDHDHGHHSHACHHHSSNPSVHQTLGELDFERGVWSSALAGDFVDVERKLKKDPSVVNQCDQSGFTALHYASRNGHIDICRILIDNGADVNAMTMSTKSTPLHRAAYMGYLDIVTLLLAHGANGNMEDCDGKTATDKAKERGHDKLLTVLQRDSSCGR